MRARRPPRAASSATSAGSADRIATARSSRRSVRGGPRGRRCRTVEASRASPTTRTSFASRSGPPFVVRTSESSRCSSAEPGCRTPTRLPEGRARSPAATRSSSAISAGGMTSDSDKEAASPCHVISPVEAYRARVSGRRPDSSLRATLGSHSNIGWRLRRAAASRAKQACGPCPGALCTEIP
jgi:hypothetical protein